MTLKAKPDRVGLNNSSLRFWQKGDRQGLVQYKCRRQVEELAVVRLTVPTPGLLRRSRLRLASC